MGKPFEKGDIRINRKGRPKKGQTMTDILSWALDQKRQVTDSKTGEEKSLLLRHLLAEKLIALAESGDLAALKYVFDRIDGKPTESIELTDGAVEARLKEIMNGA